MHQVENRNYHVRLTWRKLWAMSSVSFTRSSNAPNTPPGCPLPGLPGRSGVLLLSPLFPNPLGQRGSNLGLGMILSPCGHWESLGCCGRKKGGSSLSQMSVVPFDVSPSMYSVRDSTTSTGLHKPLAIINKIEICWVIRNLSRCSNKRKRRVHSVFPLPLLELLRALVEPLRDWDVQEIAQMCTKLSYPTNKNHRCWFFVEAQSSPWMCWSFSNVTKQL